MTSGCRGDLRNGLGPLMPRAGEPVRGERSRMMRRSRAYGGLWYGARREPGTISDYTGAAGEAQSVLLSVVPAAAECLRSTSWAKAPPTSDPLVIQGKA